MKKNAYAWLAALAVLLGAILALSLALKQSLRVDEVYTLAIASGHSLEQRGDVSDPAWGDFVLPDMAVPASYYSQYLRLKPGFTFPKDVLRAALISGSDPPAYYLLLNAWMRVWGSGDFALRAFSLLCWLACFPLLWRLGRRLGSDKAALFVCVFFALGPPAFYWADWGRMAALLWLEALGLAELGLSLIEKFSRRKALAWATLGWLGLYTHYMFGAVWIACAIVLYRGIADHGRARRVILPPLIFFLPWLLLIPGSMTLWRVSQGRSAIASPLREAAQGMVLKSGDQVLVDSIPSGILGVARYLPPETPVAGWVQRYPFLDLGRDLAPRIAGSRRVWLLWAHPDDGRRGLQTRMYRLGFLHENFKSGAIEVGCYSPMAGVAFPAR